MNELITSVEEWAIERNLHTADPNKQILKLMEELGELAEGMAKGNEKAIYDGIGDMKVVLTILKMQLENNDRSTVNISNSILSLLMYEVGLLAREVLFSKDIVDIKQYIRKVEMNLDSLCDSMEITLESCTELAYNEIKDRKGKMIDGVFVKQEDLKGQ